MTIMVFILLTNQIIEKNGCISLEFLFFIFFVVILQNGYKFHKLHETSINMNLVLSKLKILLNSTK